MNLAAVVAVGSALVCALLCVGLAWAHVWHLSDLRCFDLPSAAELRELTFRERCDRVDDQALPGSWQRSLIDDLRAASDDRQRLAAVNEALTALEFELSRRAPWPRAAIWLAAGGTALALVGGLLLGGELPVLWALLPGAIGVSAVLWVNRAAGQQITRSRSEIDDFVEALVVELSRTEVSVPARRAKRRQRFSR